MFWEGSLFERRRRRRNITEFKPSFLMRTQHSLVVPVLPEDKELSVPKIGVGGGDPKGGVANPILTGGSLTYCERAALLECEKTIRASLRTFFEVGRALHEINRRKLYRETHSTFSAYCQDKWKMGRFYAYRLMNAAKVVQQLLTSVNTPLPIHECQVRPMTKLSASAIPRVWSVAVSIAAGRQVKIADVKEAIDREGNRKRSPRQASASPLEIKHSPQGYRRDALFCLERMRRALRVDEVEEAKLWYEKLGIIFTRL